LPLDKVSVNLVLPIFIKIFLMQLKFVFILIGGLLSANAFAQVKITVQKGQKYQVESSIKLTSVAEAMGQSMESSSDTKITTLYEVKDVENAEIKMESTITKIKAESAAMGQSNSYDSDKPNNDGPLVEPLSAMLNKPKTIKLDNKGTITKADAPAATDAALMALGAGNGDAKIELFIPALMDKDLRAGESYPDNVSAKTEKMSTTDSGFYKINSIENGIANISYTGTQRISGEMEQMGMAMNITSEGKVNMEIKLDTRTGLVISKNGTNDANMSIDVMGMTIPSTAKTTTNISVSPLK
jgi:hypothetical protein